MGLSFTPKLVSVMAILCLSLLFSASSAKPTAYEVLKEYDFPVGILPKGVLGYKLNRTTGRFSAHLNGTCTFTLEGSYELKYQSTITGIISKDKLTELKGVSVKILLFWINIIEVTREGNELRFSVGIASANFPLSNFNVCPQCGCGLDCVNGQVRKFTRSHFVSSS